MARKWADERLMSMRPGPVRNAGAGAETALEAEAAAVEGPKAAASGKNANHAGRIALGFPTTPAAKGSGSEPGYPPQARPFSPIPTTRRGASHERCGCR